MNQMDYRQMVPSFDQMMIPVLQAIKKLGGKGSNDDIDKIAIQIMNLPDEVLKVPHNTTPYCSEVHYRLRWTRTYLKKYGIIHNIRRGFWAFTESFDGNIDSIDPAIIAKTVRNMNLETFHQSDLTKIESNVAFEKFIISGLKDYLESQNKGLVIAPLSDKNSFDAILPDGIDDLHKTIYVIISNNRSHIAHNTIQKLLGAKAYDWETECVLIIWGAILPEPIKSQFRADADQAGHIMVWDYNDFSNKIIQASNYMDYLITPKKTLVQDAIGDAPKAMSESEESIQKDRLEGLKKAYQNQDIVLILGAGVSMDAGIPLWSKLINDLLVYMVDKLQGSKLNKNQLRQLSELALKNQQGSPITEMRYIKAALESDTENADNVNEIIHHVLYPQKVHSDTELIHSIINLSTPKRNHIGVKQIITYNFDDLIENQLESHNIDFNVIYKDTDLSNGQSLNIYHVHGFLPQRMEPT